MMSSIYPPPSPPPPALPPNKTQHKKNLLRLARKEEEDDTQRTKTEQVKAAATGGAGEGARASLASLLTSGALFRGKGRYVTTVRDGQHFPLPARTRQCVHKVRPQLVTELGKEGEAVFWWVFFSMPSTSLLGV